MIVEISIAIILLIASIIDIKTREVPNFLSYALFALVAYYVVQQAIIQKEYTIILYSAIGLIVSGLIGYILYRLGQWGGGDVKLLFSLGMFYGLKIEYIPKLLIFMMTTFLAGGIIGILYSIFVAIKNHKEFRKNATKILEKKEVHYIRRIITLSVLIIILITFFLPSIYTYMILGVSFILWIGFFLWILIKSVEDIIMIKEREVEKLVEGDWLLKPIKAKGIIIKPREIGMTKEDLKQIRTMGIKKVQIKEGLPFVPSFFIGFIITQYSNLWLPQ